MFDFSSFVFTFDLKGANHHIDSSPSHRTYLGFSVEKDNISRYFVFNSLPFGINTSGHIFTKTLRVLIKYWRSLGHKVIMFLDDGIGGSVSYDQALISSKFIRNSLMEFGFLIAEEKCKWEPSLYCQWLGHSLDFSINRIFITEERVKRLEIALESILAQILLDSSTIPVRFLASVVGQIVAMLSVMGKTVCLKTKFLHKCIMARYSWNSLVQVEIDAVQELIFWKIMQEH